MSGLARSWIAIAAAIMVGAALAALVGLSAQSWLGALGIRPTAAAESIGPPPRATPRRLVLGFRDYDANCVTCHGAPGNDRAVWAHRMNPAPPDFRSAGPDHDARELFAATCRGVNMSGMPAWGVHRSDYQIWNIVLFVRAMPSVSPEAYQALRKTYGPAPEPFALAPDAACLGAR